MERSHMCSSTTLLMTSESQRTRTRNNWFVLLLFSFFLFSPTTFPPLSHHFPTTFPPLSHHFPTTFPPLSHHFQHSPLNDILSSSHFISFHLISSHFISSHLISSHLISFHFCLLSVFAASCCVSGCVVCAGCVVQTAGKGRGKPEQWSV